jgi:hypothetical protein
VRCFEKALALDPRCESAAVALADVYIEKGVKFYPNASKLLTTTLGQVSSVRLLTRLGKLNGLMGDYEAAIERLNTAISIATEPAEPIAELERIETLLREPGQRTHDLEAKTGRNGVGMDQSVDTESEDTRQHLRAGDEDGEYGTHSGHGAAGMTMEEMTLSGVELSGSVGGIHMGFHGEMSDSEEAGDMSMGHMAGSPLNQPDFGGSPAYYT